VKQRSKKGLSSNYKKQAEAIAWWMQLFEVEEYRNVMHLKKVIKPDYRLIGSQTIEKKRKWNYKMGFIFKCSHKFSACMSIEGSLCWGARDIYHKYEAFNIGHKQGMPQATNRPEKGMPQAHKVI